MAEEVLSKLPNMYLKSQISIHLKCQKNLQADLEEVFEEFPEYADVLERSITKWLVSADVDEIIGRRPSLSLVSPAPYATGLFLCEPSVAASDELSWESVKLMTTKERVHLYYKRHTLSMTENSSYEKRIYKPYEECGAVAMNLLIIDIPQETSGDETDKSSASVSYGYPAGYESPVDCGYSDFGVNANDDDANDDGVKTENGNSQKEQKVMF